MDSRASSTVWAGAKVRWVQSLSRWARLGGLDEEDGGVTLHILIARS